MAKASAPGGVRWSWPSPSSRGTVTCPVHTTAAGFAVQARGVAILFVIRWILERRLFFCIYSFLSLKDTLTFKFAGGRGKRKEGLINRSPIQGRPMFSTLALRVSRQGPGPDSQ